jgi:hypothetical protein
MSDVSASAVDASVEVLPFRDSYEASLEEIVAVPDDQLVVINVDMPTALTTALGALPEIRPLRARLVEELPKFDIKRFDKLEPYTRASYHAHTLFMAASKPPEPVPQLAEQCSNLIATFRKDIEALVQRGLLDGNLLRNLRGTIGYRDIAFDLSMLTQVLRENWPKIEGKSALVRAELDQGEMLVTRLTLAIGHREQAPAVVGEAAVNRQRAFTLFMRTYSDARRAITYLMPDKVDEIIPSLHVPRGPAKKKPEAANNAPESPAPIASPPNGQPPLATPSPKVASDSPYTA